MRKVVLFYCTKVLTQKKHVRRQGTILSEWQEDRQEAWELRGRYRGLKLITSCLVISVFFFFQQTPTTK